MQAREFMYTLDDIFEITENMKPMFVESLNSKFSDIIWTKSGTIFTGVGTFKEYPNQQIIITITVFPYIFNGSQYNTAYIEFVRVIDGISTIELLDLDMRDRNYIDPATVFGAVFNALISKIKTLNAQYTIAALVFTVDKKEIKRLSLYNRMLSRAHGNNTWKIILTFDDVNYSGLVASKHIFTDDELVQLKAELAKQAGKQS